MNVEQNDRHIEEVQVHGGWAEVNVHKKKNPKFPKIAFVVVIWKNLRRDGSGRGRSVD